MDKTPIAILYEHPEWFKPLFAELDSRGVRYEELYVGDHVYDPSVRRCSHPLVVNRVSAHPSEGTHPQVVLYVKDYLWHLELVGACVVNGYRAYSVGASKAAQLGILAGLGLRFPRAKVIHHVDQALEAAEGLGYPLLVKPNIGGSGAGIVRVDSRQDLELAVRTRAIDLGIDHTGLVQEWLPAKGNSIVRVEVLGGEFLYAIRLPMSEESFNYCPADGCNVEFPDLAIEPYTPPRGIIRDVIRIMEASQADLGSVEYLTSEKDGQVYYFDINPLSNFVTDGASLVGFDPVARLVDYILVRRDGG